jgi:3-hydroxybutyryl-CoA dehydrogenase
MILAVLANDLQKEEMAVSPFFRKHEVLFSENISSWSDHMADAFLDLSFENTAERIEKLAKLLPKPVFVHSVTDTLEHIHPDLIRMNAWPGFLKGNCLEAAASDEIRVRAETILGNEIIFVKDEPGFVSARILAMIINEAYFTWEAGVSSKDEIDIAMKLGTGYPLGPFEWGEKIGISQVAELLKRLSIDDPVYEMATSLNSVVNENG